MSFALINSTVAGSSGGASFSSTAQSTSGATLLTAVVASYTAESDPTISDSAGNTWTLILGDAAGVVKLRVYYVNSNTPNTSGSHTVTLTNTSGLAYAAVVFAAFSGSAAAPLDTSDSRSTGAATTTNCAFTAITPAVNGSLVLGVVAWEAATSGLSVDSGLTVIQFLPLSGGNSMGIGVAWKEQATAAAINPTFSWTNTVVSCAGMAAFAPGAAPSGTRPVKMAGHWGGFAGESGGFAG